MKPLEAWFLGSRKFIVMLAIILIASSFRLTGYITSPDFTSLLTTVGVSFMAANSVEQMMVPIKDWLAAKVNPNAD